MATILGQLLMLLQWPGYAVIISPLAWQVWSMFNQAAQWLVGWGAHQASLLPLSCLNTIGHEEMFCPFHIPDPCPTCLSQRLQCFPAVAGSALFTHLPWRSLLLNSTHPPRWRDTNTPKRGSGWVSTFVAKLSWMRCSYIDHWELTHQSSWPNMFCLNIRTRYIMQLPQHPHNTNSTHTQG